MHPDPQSLRFFVTRWLDKGRRVRSTDGLGAFDKFLFTYIAFNTLYTTAAYVVEGQSSVVAKHAWQYGALGHPPVNSYRSEKLRATRLVVDLGGEALRSAVLKKQKDVEKLCVGFGPGQLYLHETPQGEPNYDADRLMIETIKAGNLVQMFELIYMVRCNFFHGQKALSDVQNTLLTACRNLLTTACEVLLAAIEARAAGSST